MSGRRKEKLLVNWEDFKPTSVFHGFEFLLPLKIVFPDLKLKKSDLIQGFDPDRIIEMAWEDRTSFEVIYAQFGINEAGVIELMRKTLKPSSFKLWRKRVNSGVSRKHAQKRNPEINRFKCSRQRSISLNKISKRS